ncbi:class C sortase [Bifidobacterium miconisargentati]|uniref:class C sortase n=1 Tax=Bifidobacterium miconisargentati TaxID=2834437 RepID=UPI001BDC8A83|nr:class C sortase [Bifidobacterium miconisargentati]MBW3089239.1 class C sortase [Bifidobacterium miconisargentati]
MIHMPSRRTRRTNNGNDTPKEPVASARRELRRRWTLKWVSVLLAFLASATLCTVAVTQAVTGARLAQASELASQQPSAEQKQAFHAAQAYNKRLYENGQYVLGETQDPFAQVQGETRPASETDQAYVDALNMDGDGTMGSVSIPKINVDLPILHGTSLETLDRGAGHMYGTSLPVGGKNTHSVISAHNGMSSALMFTHLDELKTGDVFYLHVAGHVLAYKVDRIDVIMPNDFSKLTIEQDEDRVTLMTCTTLRKTKRLLVSGTRASMPDVAPYEQDAEHGNPVLDDPFALGSVASMPCVLGYAGFNGWQCRREHAGLPGKHKG